MVVYLFIVPNVLTFGSRTLLVILIRSHLAYVFNAVVDSADLSKSSVVDRGVGVIRSLSAISLVLASLICRRIEASCIFSSCKTNNLLKRMLLEILYVGTPSKPQVDRMFA